MRSRTEAFYIGALGSRRNQERRRERLLEAGVEEQQFERVSGPTGLDIGADTPAETALSILGEILATRAGRDGGFLRNSKTRIHVEEPQPAWPRLGPDPAAVLGSAGFYRAQRSRDGR